MAAREIAVYLADPETIDEVAAAAVLTDDEMARLARFRFARDRTVARASRVLQRRALSAYDGDAVAPAAWRFAPDPQGRPQIVAPVLGDPLSWNVANTHGLVACAITRGRALGIDVEPARADAPPEIVASHFAPAEQAALAALPVADQPRRFVELWTLKEAYLKARGVGLALPLAGFAFDPATTPPGFAIDAALADHPARWQLAQWWPTPAHCVAICVERGDGDGGGDATIDVRW